MRCADACTCLAARPPVLPSSVQGNRVARYITFDPSDTTYTSWFSGDYAVDSDWTDLLTAEKNYFSMAGDATNGREFFVNGNYGGCTVDSGWMVLDNEAADPCTWETANNGDSGAIDILYSPLTTESPADAQWVQADTFAVLVDIDVVRCICISCTSSTLLPPTSHALSLVGATPGKSPSSLIFFFFVVRCC